MPRRDAALFLHFRLAPREGLSRNSTTEGKLIWDGAKAGDVQLPINFAAMADTIYAHNL
jgi:hypothetical protein